MEIPAINPSGNGIIGVNKKDIFFKVVNKLTGALGKLVYYFGIKRINFLISQKPKGAPIAKATNTQVSVKSWEPADKTSAYAVPGRVTIEVVRKPTIFKQP